MPFDATSLEWVAARFGKFVFSGRSSALLRGAIDECLDAVPRPFRRLAGRQPSVLYVKARCTGDWRRFFPHVTLKDVADLPTHWQQHEFDNLDFELSPVMSLGVTRCCTAVRKLSSYPIATIRTGQFERRRRKSTDRLDEGVSLCRRQLRGRKEPVRAIVQKLTGDGA